MFNFFRRKRGSVESIDTDISDKMPSEEDGIEPDENQNVDTDCILRNHGDQADDSVLPKTNQSQLQVQSVQPVKNCKKVRWADMEMPLQESSDNSTQESSSEEEEVSHDEETDEEDEEESRLTINEEDRTSIELENVVRIEEVNVLKNQLSQLERDMSAKSALIDRLQIELKEAYQDAEAARYKMSNLQEELEETKKNLEESQRERDNQSLDSDSEDEEERIRNEEKLREAEERIKQLEERLNQTIQEKQQVEDNLNKLQQDKHQEIDILQKACEDAIREQDELIEKFDEDFEALRTLNSKREQQLLEDFEWKLREVEKACKLRMEKREKDKDKEITDLVCKLADINAQLKEANKLQISKAELDQTKSSNTELKRNLRQTNRRLEEVQVNEKVLQEETSRLRTQLDKEKSFITNLQMVHREELDERERKMTFRLDVQRNQIVSDWEEKLKKEIRRTKTEMERKAKEETQEATEEMRRQMEEKIKRLKNDHEEKVKQLTCEIEDLKRRLNEKNVDHREALENVQTRSDAELVELRRKMEKLYMSYEEKIEKINDQHDQQISRLQDESERKIQQMESSFQMHAGTTRATVELVKEQLQREHQSRLQQLENQHQKQLEEQWNRLSKDKEAALKSQEGKHRDVLKRIQQQMELLKSQKNTLEKENQELGSSRENSISSSDSVKKISPQIAQTSDRTNAHQSLRAELGEAEANLVREKDRLEELTLKAKMCQTIQQLTVQLETRKKEIESLNSRLKVHNNQVASSADIQQALPQVAKVQPQITKEPPQVAKVQPQMSKEPPQTPPATKVQPPSATLHQSYNQSRGRHKKHRSRRH